MKKTKNPEMVNDVMQEVDNLLKDSLVIREGNVYSNYDADTEADVQKSISKALEFAEENFKQEQLEKFKVALLLAKYWQDRELFKKIRAEIIKPLSIESGFSEITSYEQQVLRQSYSLFDAFGKCTSRLNFAFNYLKPRANSRKKMVQIKVSGQLRMIESSLLDSIKNSTKNKEDMVQKLIEASVPSADQVEEF